MKFLYLCRTWTGSNLLGSVLYWLHLTNIVKASYIMLSLPCYQIAVNRLTWSMDSNQSNSPLLRKATVVEIWPFSSALQKGSDIKIQFKMHQQYSFLTQLAQVEQSVWINKCGSYNKLGQEGVQVQEIIEAWASDERARHHQSKEIRKNRVGQTA